RELLQKQAASVLDKLGPDAKKRVLDAWKARGAADGKLVFDGEPASQPSKPDLTKARRKNAKRSAARAAKRAAKQASQTAAATQDSAVDSTMAMDEVEDGEIVDGEAVAEPPAVESEPMATPGSPEASTEPEPASTGPSDAAEVESQVSWPTSEDEDEAPT